MINTDRDRLARTLNFRIAVQREDSAEVLARADEPFLNGVNIAHGGFLFALCDYASALASNTETRTAITSASSIDFIEPALPGAELLAVAELSASTPKTGVYRVYITDAQTRTKRFAVFTTRVVFKTREGAIS